MISAFCNDSLGFCHRFQLPYVILAPLTANDLLCLRHFGPIFGERLLN
jgi:hypothetical protein